MGSEICSITVTSAVVVVTVTPRVISKSGGKNICRLDFRIRIYLERVGRLSFLLNVTVTVQTLPEA